ncbi:conserved hypothetical protein [Uncinocarpus reesii 1704]|uniref:THUMP domain-containing protein n=1 Tax=Uncinocarpus reesii (strain UAMH 1704) TaxID=336963 RepID=C4JZ93_UNCRE|nr:uncharacterized protein UREG_07494 [Uncinocarpus reesii 1704]EEP82629.1 conserved hypothetical protein [Uncinocarpus reesii 1704]
MSEVAGQKRAAPDEHSDRKQKRKKQWRTPGPKLNVKRTIESGDSGIFVTCDRGREGKCTAEILDLLSQEVPNAAPNESEENDSAAAGSEDDIEAQIRKEVECMKPTKKSRALFEAVRLDIPCVLFIRMDKTLDPVDLVHRICMDAHANPEKKRSRYVKRLTPITSIRKLRSGGLEELAGEVLEPHFHTGSSKKYAIRPSVRNNHEWPRDTVIQLVARAVGQGHTVDLKNYDVLILVEVMQCVEILRCALGSFVGDQHALDSSAAVGVGVSIDPR